MPSEDPHHLEFRGCGTAYLSRQENIRLCSKGGAFIGGTWQFHQRVRRARNYDLNRNTPGVGLGGWSVIQGARMCYR